MKREDKRADITGSRKNRDHRWKQEEQDDRVG